MRRAITAPYCEAGSDAALSLWVINVELNSYASPLADIGVSASDAATMTQAERVRHQHLNREAAIQAIGLLWYLGGGFQCLSSVVGAGVLFIYPTIDSSASVFLAGVFSIGLVSIAIAHWLRHFFSGGRLSIGVLSAFAMLGFPFLALVNAYVLYLLFSRKGAMVFSSEYQEIMRQTPHMKYGTAVVIWELCLMLAALMIGVILSIVLTRAGLLQGFTSKQILFGAIGMPSGLAVGV
jgi:hypothetical protein